MAMSLAAALLAGCAKGDFTPPKQMFKSTACKGGCTNTALVISADGRYVAASGKDETQIFEIGGHYDPTRITIGGDKLASSPDGRFLLMQHALDSPGGVGIRLFRFDIGQTVYRDPGVITGLLKRDRHNPFRKSGEVLEVSPYNSYSEVQALDWRYRRLTLYSVNFPNGGADPGNAPRLMAIADDPYRTAWSRDRPDPRGVITMFGVDGTVRDAETAWPEPPEWRTFSLNGALYAAESKGRVAIWDVRTGKITNQLDRDGYCMLSGGGAPRVGQLTVVCADKAVAATRLTAWLFPGREPLFDLSSGDGWTIRDWRVVANGSRMAVLDTRSGAGGGGKVRARIRVATMGRAAREPVVIDLGEVDQPQFIVMSMSGSGRLLAVRMPNGDIRIYEPDALAAGASSGA